MCFFDAPEINIPDTPTPAPLPPPIDEDKTVGEIQLGGQAGTDKGTTGKSQLKIPKNKPNNTLKVQTGVNHNLR